MANSDRLRTRVLICHLRFAHLPFAFSYAAIRIDTGALQGPISPLALVQRAKYVAILPSSAMSKLLTNSERVTKPRNGALEGSLAAEAPTDRNTRSPAAPCGLARRVGVSWSAARTSCVSGPMPLMARIGKV